MAVSVVIVVHVVVISLHVVVGVPARVSSSPGVHAVRIKICDDVALMVLAVLIVGPDCIHLLPAVIEVSVLHTMEFQPGLGGQRHIVSEDSASKVGI